MSSNPQLDRFDEPARLFLESQIRELGYDPSELRPVTDKALEEGKKNVGEIARPLPPQLMLAKLEEDALVRVQAVLSQTKKWESARERIRSYSSVFVVGAGTSFETGVPLNRVLEDLLRFCEVGNWDELRNDEQKCLRFKSEFGRLCDVKEPGTSHKLIASNFDRHILEIICLNWDNLIERAAKTLRRTIPKVNEDIDPGGVRYLWKFHGDVENLKGGNAKGRGGWVFPGEEGHVFDSFEAYCRRSHLTEHIFVLVIIGYSESDKDICDKVIDVFGKNPPRPTFRIGLDLNRLPDEFYVVGPSEFILRKILPVVSP